MRPKTKRLLQTMIWVFITVLIGTCIWASIKEQTGHRIASATDQAIILGIISTCMFFIAVFGIILMLKAEETAEERRKRLWANRRH